jgi:hypothetical protein
MSVGLLAAKLGGELIYKHGIGVGDIEKADQGEPFSDRGRALAG